MPRTLASLVAEVAARGDLPALVAVRQDAVETWSCGRLAHAARSLAAGLIMHGVRPGDRVALFAANAPEWISYLNMFRGRHREPLDATLRQDEALRQIRQQPLAVVGARQAQLLAVAGRPAAVRVRRSCRARASALLLGSRVAPPPDVNEAALAALLYTSGTTGEPKGVLLTHGNLMANVDALARQRLAGPGERVLVPLPLHHAYPMTVGALGALASGAAIVLPEGLSGPEIADALRLGRATVMIAVPRLLEAMVAAIEARAAARGRLAAGLAAGLEVAQRLGPAAGRRLFGPLRRAVGPDLRTLASGGARLEPATARRLAALGFEILVGYGLTETAPLLAFTPRGRVRLDTVGRPLSGVELRLAGDGEILARGACVFSGYWRNPTATASAFTADGWFAPAIWARSTRTASSASPVGSRKLSCSAAARRCSRTSSEATYGQSLIREIAVLERDGRLVALVVPDEAALKARGLRAADALHDGSTARRGPCRRRRGLPALR
jgi:long-chain acyl-CoA synthetase